MKLEAIRTFGSSCRERLDLRPIGLALVLAAASSCRPSPPPSRDEGEQSPPPPRSRFVDISERAGVRFEHHSDASPQRRLPETMGAGAAFFDYDGDGFADLYLVNGCSLEERGDSSTGRLYRNLQGKGFEDVTAGSGLQETFYGMGAAAADIDNDGDIDMLVTALDGCRLYRNTQGRFENITAQAGLSDREFSSSAAFLDYDRDGFLDLFVARYVHWTAGGDIPCRLDGRNRTYCTPEEYPGLSSLLYRNLGSGRFEDVSTASGIAASVGKGLGVAVVDYDHNELPDIAVANDTVRNFLFVNQGNGRFVDRGIESGMAYSESGAARGGMGIDAGDVDGDGNPDLLIGNFSQEMAGLYRGSPDGFFIDEAAPLGIGIPTLMTLAFGTLLEDLDGDGMLDALIANGHIEPDIARSRRSLSYAQPPQLFWNLGDGHFEPFQAPPEDALAAPLVARGLACADIDADGDLDLVITQNGREARLIRNDSPANHWLRLVLTAANGNATPFGTRVEVRSGDTVLTRTLTSGRSYLSACEPILTLGLGAVDSVDRLQIRWPSGQVQIIENPSVDRALRIHEP